MFLGVRLQNQYSSIIYDMKVYNRILFAWLTLLLIPFTLMGQSTDRLQKLDQYLSELSEYDKFMGSVAVIEGDDLIYTQAVGQIDSAETSADPNTMYRIGSMTKVYTATIVMQLIEEGELNLDDKLSEFYPDLPNANQITIEHLLRHRSGLTNMTSLREYLEYYTEETTRDEMLERFARLETRFEPGSQFEYSNTGYVLLGYIIEDITGLSYGEALALYVTEPAALQQTYYGMELKPGAVMASSFTYDGKSWNNTPSTNFSVPHGAGAIVATASDVVRFFESLFEGEIVSESSLEQMMLFQDGYGLGLVRIPFYEKVGVGHNGVIDGFQLTAANFQNEDLTFAILGNGINQPLNEVALGVLSILFERDYEIPDFSVEPDLVTLTEREKEQFTGSYSSEDIPLEIDVFIQGGSLMAQATGQGPFPLTSYEGGIMKFHPASLEMVFGSLADGKYQGFDLNQGGQTYRFTRKPD